MTVGNLNVIADPGFRIIGNRTLITDPGVFVRAALTVIAGDGDRVIGVLSVAVPNYPDQYHPPTVSVRSTAGAPDVPGSAKSRGAGPIDLSVRYSVGDMAWTLDATFPPDVAPTEIDVDLGGALPTTFTVETSDVTVTADSRRRRVRAVYSLADILTQSYCLDVKTWLFRPASALFADLLSGIDVTWNTVDFNVSIELFRYLTAFKTRNRIARELLQLAAADLVITPGGAVVRDTAPDAAVAERLDGQILEWRQSSISPVELTGVFAAAVGDSDNAPVLEYEVISSGTARQEYRVKLYAWPNSPRIDAIRMEPLGPSFAVMGPFPRKERIREIVEFRSGRARIRPLVVTGNVIAWEGTNLGAVTFHESGRCVAAILDDSTAHVEIVRDYHEIIIRAGTTPTISVLPANWNPDWTRYDGVRIEIDVEITGVNAPGAALVRTADTGRVADEPIIAPDERLIAYIGQRWLRQQNARQFEARIAGWRPDLVGKALDLGFGAVIVDDITLTSRGGRAETRISGRMLMT